MKEQNDSIKQSRQTATLGGGCFWCLEAIYDDLKGVERVESGYAGGHTANPTYEQVCSGMTGHAEVIQLDFDPDVISYRDILNIFFLMRFTRKPLRFFGLIGATIGFVGFAITGRRSVC